MENDVQELLAALKSGESHFSEVITFIDSRKEHQPVAFKNGEITNEATQNQGSARVFLFAKEQNLDEEDTLRLFAEHYQAVISDLNGDNHQNIRQFMKHGWAGVEFYFS